MELNTCRRGVVGTLGVNHSQHSECAIDRTAWLKGIQMPKVQTAGIGVWFIP